MIPVDTFVNGVAIGSWVLVVQNPIERHNGRVKFAHEILSNVIDAMLIMSLVHLRDFLLFGSDGG